MSGSTSTQMYPAGGPPDKELADTWTWDFFLTRPRNAHKAGYPFGMPMGQTRPTRSTGSARSSPAYGAELVDEKGNITVKSDATKQVLEWFKKLVPFLPPDVFAWDDAGNNKCADLGQGRADHEPALGLGGREARRAASRRAVWTFASPKGPKGRYEPFLPFFWGIWNFSPNKSAAKSLLTHLSAAPSVEQLVAGEPGL